MGRYPIVQVFGWMLMALGAVTWAFTGVFVVYVLSVGSQIVSDLLVPLQPLLGDFATNVTQVSIAAVVFRVVVSGVVGGIVLMGIGQFVHMMNDMADDVRSLRLLRDREMTESRRQDNRR